MIRTRPEWLLTAVATLLVCGVLFAQETEVPDSSEAFAEAWKKYQAGEPSVDLFTSIVSDESASEKDRFNSAYLLGVIALSAKSYDECLTHLDAADEILEDRPQVSLRRAEALIGKQQYKPAAKALKKCKKKIKKKSPLFPKLQLALAQVDEQTGNVEKAAARLEAVGRKKKVSWEIPFRLATYYEKLDNPTKAIDTYERVIQLDPKQDPWGGIYAYQRWAALKVSSNQGSYSNKPLLKQAVERYNVFLDRASANNVPSNLISATQQAKSALEMFGG